MIIAQISDLHLGFDGQDAECQNTQRLHLVLDTLTSMRKAPDMVLVTGDLVEHGAEWAYERLKTELDKLKWPYFLALGNHDRRAPFKHVFSHLNLDDGFLHYTIEDWPLRVIVLDTLEEERHGGGFCPKRAQWLSSKLSEQPERPTLIALHHPPIDTGIAWMTANTERPWVTALKQVIEPYDNIVRMIAGHIHRPMFAEFAGTTLSVCPAVAPEVTLELETINPDVPDDRPLLVDASPGFAVHFWKDDAFVTHTAAAPFGRPIVHFDDAHASVVKHTLDIAQ